jgi:endonuclease YncB( thermonuclease family)
MKRSRWLSILLVLLLAAYASAAEIRGKVVGVVDGDTIDILADGKKVRIRLAEIDCPEKAQAFGKRAKEAASDLAFDKEVRVEIRDHDRYGRTVGAVTLPDGRSLNEELVREGMAWWYKRYSKNRGIGVIEEEARAAKRGLWADAHPTPPWEFRRQKTR